MTVRRKSIWEDYSKRDANGTALVDGVNTISPVIAEDFLGPTWITRPNDSIEPKLIVWGSGGGNTGDENAEVNATVTSWENNGDPMRTINILNQGKGFEPNSTMAVLHYPIEPFAYWTFDRHETLFEDSSEARYQPSPAWNREHKAPSLAEYWSFEEDVAGVSGDPVLDEDNFENWGLLGKCISLEPSQEITAIVSLDANFTFSIWFNALDTFEVVIAGETLTIEPRVPNNWSHLAIVKGE